MDSVQKVWSEAKLVRLVLSKSARINGQREKVGERKRVSLLVLV